jgi:hypothetical protein
MVLNIGKYQVPYIEYGLFKDYIAENLCVKKNEVINCCQGKCFLEKRIDQVNESDSDTGNPVEKRQISPGADDYIKVSTFLQMPSHFIKVRLSVFRGTRISKTIADIPVPPPKRFIS